MDQHPCASKLLRALSFENDSHKLPWVDTASTKRAKPKVTLDSRLDSVGDWRSRALQGVERSSSPGTAGNFNSCSFLGWFPFALVPLERPDVSALEGAFTSQLALWKLLISIPFPYRSLKREERKSKTSSFSFSLLTSFQQTFVSPTCVHNNGYNPVVIYEPVKWGFAPTSVNCLSVYLSTCYNFRMCQGSFPTSRVPSFCTPPPSHSWGFWNPTSSRLSPQLSSFGPSCLWEHRNLS